MGVRDALRWMVGSDGLATRSIDSFVDHPGLTEQLLAVQGLTARPWRAPGIREILGVPAILRATSMISQTTGSLSMRGLKDEVEVDPQDRPRIIIRPDPNRTPRDFYMGTAWNVCTRGEAWWYVSKRDNNGIATALYNIPDPAEVQVERSKDPIRPDITWRGRSTKNGTLSREDMRQIVYLLEPNGLRGWGPLQICGAAASVAVEAQEWAANFYAAGGYPSIWIKAAGTLGADDDGWSSEDQVDAGASSEIDRLKEQWISTAPNTPKITDEGIVDIKQFDPNPSGAQMLESRNYQNGDAARMFSIPGTLLDYFQSGSALTYQNLDDEFIKWVRLGLRPGYLEPIEQAMSDLLVRDTVARFNTWDLESPNTKTRFEIYKLAVEVLGPEDAKAYAMRHEGLAPGDVESAPVPFALFTPSIPAEQRTAPAVVHAAPAAEVRCTGQRLRLRGGVTVLEECGRLLAEVGPFVGKCPRCKTSYPSAA